MAKRVEARLRTAKKVGKIIVGVVLAAFILFGSYGGTVAYYEMYRAKTGVTVTVTEADGSTTERPLHRNNLLDMVLISAVKAAQEDNARRADQQEP